MYALAALLITHVQAMTNKGGIRQRVISDPFFSEPYVNHAQLHKNQHLSQSFIFKHGSSGIDKDARPHFNWSVFFSFTSPWPYVICGLLILVCVALGLAACFCVSTDKAEPASTNTDDQKVNKWAADIEKVKKNDDGAKGKEDADAN